MPQSVAQLPWGHNRLIITKIKDIEEAGFYCNETIRNGWDRDTLEVQIENKLYSRLGSVDNNFSQILPVKQSKLASETLKDPSFYSVDKKVAFIQVR